VKCLAIGMGLAAVALTAFGQDAPLDWQWVLRLSRVKHHLKDNFERIPNYVCQETVERFRNSPGRGRTVKLDHLQFDVAQVEHKELFAWPGSHGFEDRDLSSYVSSGILGTGAFSSLPFNLFVADRARLVPHKDVASQTSAGRGYDYDIPAFLRGYEISHLETRAWVGVRGTFWVDSESMDLIRIDEQVVDLPPQLGMSASSSTVGYARMQIGSSSVLLPQSAELVVVNLDGTEMRNEIKFSGCREYGSESTVRFGDPVDAPPVTKKEVSYGVMSPSTTARRAPVADGRFAGFPRHVS